MDAQPISLVILTLNEELNLPHCLKSIESLHCEAFVVDSGSSDDTIAIAESYGCHHTYHEFVNHAEQLNWALSELPIQTRWTMRLDADERLTPELVDELNRVLSTDNKGVGGFEVKRRVYFWGHWIRHGGYYPTWLLRIWRTGEARCESRWMDEHMVLEDGLIERLRHDIIDENKKGLGFWVEKHNRYADRELLDLVESGRATTGIGLNTQAKHRRMAKMGVYARAPLFLRAVLYWAYRYFLRLGVLDGVPGLVFHGLQGLWYRFLVDAKLFEARYFSNLDAPPRPDM
jgi:glycosyltransferase involved in cell wall biosynthesis